MMKKTIKELRHEKKITQKEAITVEQQDYEHLSRILDSYVLRNGERRRCFVYSELIQIARLRHAPLEKVTRETASAVGEQANNPDIREYIRRRMIPVRRTLIELLQILKLADQGDAEKR